MSWARTASFRLRLAITASQETATRHRHQNRGPRGSDSLAPPLLGQQQLCGFERRSLAPRVAAVLCHDRQNIVDQLEPNQPAALLAAQDAPIHQSSESPLR